ncbi:hypothetical protein ACFWAA_33515 [Streptomyces sp. NPDC059922]|uniref:hypothetical protein n=1 Tax=Streptomyces sp. NPDC059922 TaxID=3347005 RepID=UPI00365F4691
MSPRPTQRAPKGRDRDRADRRAVLAVLLARAQRGALTAAEGSLLARYVRDEQREAATAVIETEQDAERFKADHLSACQTIAAMHAAATGRTGMAPIRGVVEDVADVRARAEETERKLSDSERLGHRLLQRAERSEQDLAAIRSQLHDVKARRDDARAGRQDAERALAHVGNAQSLGDALAIVAQFNGLSPEAARTHGRILDQADTVEARLAEQQREHEIALAAERRNTTSAATEAREQRHRADRYRTAWLAAGRDRSVVRAAAQPGTRALALADELFVAGRTPAEREVGRRILADVRPAVTVETCPRVDEHAAHRWMRGEAVKHCAGRYMPGHPYVLAEENTRP